MNRPIRNAGKVDVDDFIAKSSKLSARQKTGTTEKVINKYAASRTRSKQVATPIARGSHSVQSPSFDSQENPKNIKDVEIRFGCLYAKGICQTFRSLMYLFVLLCFSAIMLTWVEPFFLIVEFRPLTIKPLIISSRDLFSKRARNDKSIETESSKTPLLFSPTNIPLSKKIRLDPSVTTIISMMLALNPPLLHTFLVICYSPDL